MKQIKTAKYAQESLKNCLSLRLQEKIADITITQLLSYARNKKLNTLDILSKGDVASIETMFERFLYDDQTFCFIRGCYSLCDRAMDFDNQTYENWQNWLSVASKILDNAGNTKSVSEFHMNLIRYFYLKDDDYEEICKKYASDFKDDEFEKCLENGVNSFRHSQFGRELKAIIEVAEKFATIDEFLEVVVLLSPFFYNAPNKSNTFVHYFNIGYELFKEEMVAKFAEIAPDSLADVLVEAWN